MQIFTWPFENHFYEKLLCQNIFNGDNKTNQRPIHLREIATVEIKTSGLAKEIVDYIGMTANPFEERYGNHRKSFMHEMYEKPNFLNMLGS